MAMEFYNALKTGAVTPSEEWRESLQYLINDQFENASDYYTIKKENRATKVLSDINVRLTKSYNIKQTTSIRDDYYTIIFKDNTTINSLGDMFYFNDYYYMAVDIGRTNTPTNSCMVQRCNVQLKFFDNNNNVMPTISATPIIINAIATNKLLNPTDDKIVMLPEDYMIVRIPNNSDGKKIKFNVAGGTRFLLGDPLECWNCVAYDSISDVRKTIGDNPTDINGIINLKFKKTGRNDKMDNISLGIAKQNCY